MIYLDTHVVVWLYAKSINQFSATSQNLLNQGNLLVSPIVQLELQYLYEIGRITVDATTILADLSGRIGLRICDREFSTVVSQALTLSWTRDPFDRLIVANASLHNNILLTKDQNILSHYTFARW